jgi:alanine-synthesizing transaminase
VQDANNPRNERDRAVIEEFHRIKRLPPYVFAEVNRLKASARARGADIVDLGMGNPDLPTPQHIVDKMIETIAKPRTHRYSASKGIPGLRKAQAAYYARRFGVKLNPDTQIVATLGSKEGFANMAQAITAPGDVILVPNPTYPIHEFGFLISGASMRHLKAFGRRDLVPVEPDGDDGGSRFLSRRGGSGQAAQSDRAVGYRLC